MSSGAPVILLLKSARIANQAGYILSGSPPRWRKVEGNKVKHRHDPLKKGEHYATSDPKEVAVLDKISNRENKNYLGAEDFIKTLHSHVGGDDHQKSLEQIGHEARLTRSTNLDWGIEDRGFTNYARSHPDEKVGDMLRKWEVGWIQSARENMPPDMYKKLLAARHPDFKMK